jgi:single-strand DNA-binding protein
MANVAHITVIGRLGNDPEIRYTPNEKRVANFTIAVNKRDRDGNETTTWYRCAAFGRLAETIDTLWNDGWMVKGREVCAIGNFEPREYQARDGSTRWSFDVNCDSMTLLGERVASAGTHEHAPVAPSGYGNASALDDVPF